MGGDRLREDVVWWGVEDGWLGDVMEDGMVLHGGQNGMVFSEGWDVGQNRWGGRGWDMREDGLGWRMVRDRQEWDVTEDRRGWDGMGWELHGPDQCCPLLDTLPSHNLEMKHLPGADPELVLLSHRYEELEVSGQCSTCCHRAWGGQCPTGARLQPLSGYREFP